MAAPETLKERKFRVYEKQGGFSYFCCPCDTELKTCPVYSELFSVVNNGQIPIRMDAEFDEIGFPTTIKLTETTGNNLKVWDTTYDTMGGKKVSQNRVEAHLPDGVKFDIFQKCLACTLHEKCNQK